MEKFRRAYVPATETHRLLKEYAKKWDSPGGPEYFAAFGIATREQLLEFMSQKNQDEIWLNDKYQVTVYRKDTPIGEWPQMIHLSIRRVDRKPVRDWRDLQQIKNELVGLDHEGVELFPAENRKVDTANQYHLWVLADPRMRFPFGFSEGRIVSDAEVAGSHQRALSDEIDRFADSAKE